MLKLYFLSFRPDAPDSALYALLPEDVQRRCARIKRPVQSRAIAMGHLLTRYALSQAAGCAPEEIIIERAPTGKPYSPNLGLEWSLSHTAGAAAVCVDRAPVGVDVERLAPMRRRVLARVFTEREREYVLSGQGGQDRRFFEVWTRKEAAVKRDGRGLSINLLEVDTFSDTFGTLTTFREGGYIVSVCAANPLDEKDIVCLDESALFHFFKKH